MDESYTDHDAFPFLLFSSCKGKKQKRYNGSYFYSSLFVHGLGKRKRMLNELFSIFYHQIENRKTKGRYRHGPTAQRAFPFFLFSSCERKNEKMYNGSYFYFSFFVCGLRKRKRILRYLFPIFYHEIEKRKTKGPYIHGPGRRCSNYIFIFDLTLGFNRLGKDHCKMRRETLSFGIWCSYISDLTVHVLLNAVVYCFRAIGIDNGRYWLTAGQRIAFNYQIWESLEKINGNKLHRPVWYILCNCDSATAFFKMLCLFQFINNRYKELRWRLW